VTTTQSGEAGRKPIVIAHRGASAVRPENTVEAFRHAAELGADWVELDVRRTADEVLIVHHDARLPDGRALAELEASELPTSVATLDAALDACDGMGVNVEIKNDPGDPDHQAGGAWLATAVADRLVARVVEPGRHQPDQLLVSSFDPEVLRHVRVEQPQLPAAALIVRIGRVAALMAELRAGGLVAINPFVGVVDDALVAAAQAAGLAVNVWTVDDPVRMAELIHLGVDGIITNVPDVARRVVDAA
jgi:glycerophosphoryl diester phosphodiesterase